MYTGEMKSRQAPRQLGQHLQNTVAGTNPAASQSASFDPSRDRDLGRSAGGLLATSGRDGGRGTATPAAGTAA